MQIRMARTQPQNTAKMEKVAKNGLEPPRQALPRDIFKNRFTWCCDELLRHYIYVTGMLFCSIIAYALSKIPTVNLALPLFASHLDKSPPLSFIIWPLAVLRYRNSIVSKHKMEMVRIILANQPGLEENKWDQVALEMNAFLFNEGHWNTCNFFFNGSRCAFYFRQHIVRPYYQGKFDNTPSADEKYLVQDVVTYHQQCTKRLFDSFKQEALRKPPVAYINPLKERHRCKITLGTKCCMCFAYGTLFLSSSNENKKPAIISAVLFTLFVIWGYRFDPDNEHNKLGVRSRCKFLATIISVSPGHNIQKWDYVAECMNQYLQEEHFFCGKECMKFFNEEFKPMVSDKPPSTYPELKEYVAATINACQPTAM